MANYFTLPNLQALIPAGWAVEALDDDSDGSQDQFDAVAALAESKINGILSALYDVPIDVTAPKCPVDFLRDAASVIAAALCYGRRGVMDKFPYSGELKAIYTKLNAIAAGELPLFPGVVRVDNSAVLIGEPSKVYSPNSNV
jgi:hypothetical protein